MPLNVDVTAFEEKAQQVMDSFRKGPGELKAAVGMLSPDELAGVYHYLHSEGGLGKLEDGFMDQIRSGTLQLRNPEFMRAAIALRVLMDQKPGAHQARIGMVDTPHEPTDPSKYIGGSPVLDKHAKMGRQAQGLKEGRKVFTLSEVKEIIREETIIVKKNFYNSLGLGSVYLFESQDASPKKSSFKLMLESYDSGSLTGDELLEKWNKSVDYEAARLDEIVGALKGMFGKVSDFILKVSIQAHELAKRGLQSAASAAQKIFGSAERFKEENPNLYKAAVVVGVTVAVFGLMAALDADSAQAAIKTPGIADGGIAGDTLKPGAIDALQGMISMKQDADPEMVQKALRLVQKAAEFQGEVDLSELKSDYAKFASDQLDVLDQIVAKAREEGTDSKAFKFLQKMRQAGENVQLEDLPKTAEYTVGPPTSASAQEKIKAMKAATKALNK